MVMLSVCLSVTEIVNCGRGGGLLGKIALKAKITGARTAAREAH